MKKMLILAAVTAISLFFSGCVSVESVKGANLNKQAISTSGSPVAHIDVQNWGLYLFSIPLLTGSTSEVGSIAVFKDTVNVPSVAPVITAEAKKMKASKVYNLTSQYTEFGFIIVSRNVNISGNAVK